MTLTAEHATAVLGDRTRVVDALAGADEVARSTVDADLLGCCEHRVAELLSAASTTTVATNDRERAALAFTEQWVIDVASITDELVADLTRHLGSEDQLMDFLHALLVVEQRIRLGAAWSQLGLVS